MFRADRLEDLPFCQILFIALKDAGKRRAALRALKEKPVLTLGEATDFLEEGGVIRFKVDQRVSMGINLDQSKKVSLGIQTKMLEVLRIILQDGKVRRMR
ncbi:MAG: YfiR family protein [Chromatiales bacterium]